MFQRLNSNYEPYLQSSSATVLGIMVNERRLPSTKIKFKCAASQIEVDGFVEALHITEMSGKLSFW